jgi:hypothetical protein
MQPVEVPAHSTNYLQTGLSFEVRKPGWYRTWKEVVFDDWCAVWRWRSIWKGIVCVGRRTILLLQLVGTWLNMLVKSTDYIYVTNDKLFYMFLYMQLSVMFLCVWHCFMCCCAALCVLAVFLQCKIEPWFCTLYGFVMLCQRCSLYLFCIFVVDSGKFSFTLIAH